MFAALVTLLVGFTSGEVLQYDVRYGPFTVGSLELRTLAPEAVRGESCYHFTARLETSPAYSWLFQARYDLETWCRVSDMLTLRAYKQTRETRYEDEWFAEYEPDSDRVVYSDGDTLDLAPGSRDMLTVWYYLRRLRPVVGDTLEVRTHTDRKDYDVVAVVPGEREVRTRAGTFQCFEVVPSAEGPLGRVLLSDDSERVPVIIQTRAGGMLVTAFLREASCKEES